MKIYIAGKMRGVPYYNFPAFDEAKKKLQASGWEVQSPADMDRMVGFDAMACKSNHDWNSTPDGFSKIDCVTRCIEAVMVCDAIYMLDGWDKSKGARAEKAVAEWMGKDVIYDNDQNKNI